MTRPRKQTVDFFPHMVKHGKTIFILEQKHGNDGYAAWFKILEMLGDSEGHVIDCRNPVTWEYLQAITRLHEDILQDILNLLAKLEAIDPELWQSRVIWSENFLQNVAEVYRNRKVPLPQKPHIYTSKPASSGITTPHNPAEPTFEGITTPENPQSRGEESRGENSTLPSGSVPPPAADPPSPPKRKKQRPVTFPLPDNFSISPEVQAWADKHGHTQLEEHLEAFKLKAVAKAYQYADWDSAFKTAIRENWAKLDKSNGDGGAHYCHQHPDRKAVLAIEGIWYCRACVNNKDPCVQPDNVSELIHNVTEQLTALKR